MGSGLMRPIHLHLLVLVSLPKEEKEEDWRMQSHKLAANSVSLHDENFKNHFGFQHSGPIRVMHVLERVACWEWK